MALRERDSTHARTPCNIQRSDVAGALCSAEVSKGVANVGLETGVPVMFGVLITDTIEQAIERAGTKAGNKGFEAAMGAIEMADLLSKIDGEA